MTDLSLLYGGDDNLLGDNMDNSYSTQKINKMSNNDMSIEDKSSKSQQIMLQTQMAQQAQQAHRLGTSIGRTTSDSWRIWRLRSSR